ncbi:unnamed protein product [Hyaloperonospora brassicae]|uniref:PDZ domain-containing protein n=1 Tax=Hyaloperonospora brassicae TaxID=162125 RepID=A0AAV0SWP1_HYABA|nr:unnamed protein product [Hyaloperonospora brassicae]
MGESLTVRLFVCTQTYDIPCDPRQTAKWLLLQAKTIQRSRQKKMALIEDQEELQVLYNRTSRQEVHLDASIGSAISPMDVVEARAVREPTDAAPSRAMFPWLRSKPLGPLERSSDDVVDATNGLFFQQLYAFALVGQRAPVSAEQYKQKHDQDAFLSLVHTYVTGTYDQESAWRQTQRMNSAATGQRRYSAQGHGVGGRSTSASATCATAQREIQNPPHGGRRMTVPSSPVYPPEHDPSGFSDSGSDSSVEDLSAYPTRSSLTNGYGGPQRMAAPAGGTPAQATTLFPARTGPQDAFEGMENVFDIVFKQQAIGMKLGADESKQYAIVKECFEGSEAKRYPEIQNGVVILAVNGQEVGGLGLSRVLYRLREAPRPVVVRFGRMSTHQLRERRKGRGPW